ncbi:DUF4097 family beta strand repeat-containing protein [Metabacillus sp. 84]|uniref:DUF4097 family beta strand repeat-containing protein n=1 Tax=Metabacillus sp. 84 TaxID=3404705 RepID=UPI003CF80A58
MKLVAPAYKSIKTKVIVALSDKTRLLQIGYKANFGDTSFTGLKAENIDLSVSSGKLRTEAISAGRLKLTSKSGDITAERIQGDAKIQMHSGDIKVDGLKGTLAVQSTSGNVNVTGQRSDSMDISARSGDVTLSPDPEFKGFFVLKTTSGNITAPESPQGTTDVIKVRTVSGDIRIGRVSPI